MSQLTDVKLPDIGDFSNVPVIEITVAAGDTVSEGDTIIIVESDKATLDIPVDVSGTVIEVKVAENDLVSEGSLVLTLDTSGQQSGVKESSPARNTTKATTSSNPATKNAKTTTDQFSASVHVPTDRSTGTGLQSHNATVNAATPAYASPSVRRLARQLGVNISEVVGSGDKSRILREDVKSFVKTKMTASEGNVGVTMQLSSTLASIPAWPKVDFEQFGPIKRQPLSRISRIAGPALARNAIVIPHVTHFDQSDITETELFRATLNNEATAEDSKITLLSFAVLAVVSALKQYPEFNSSLDNEELVIKNYWNIGIAADTADGLVVPVIKKADQLGLREIATKLATLANAARNGSLKPHQMQGATFTISSLGGIGGTNFTPIINAPEVAILGIPRSEIQPKWDGSEFKPRRIQPLSLSFDHRVVDGVAGARFLSHIAAVLNDFRRNAV